MLTMDRIEQQRWADRGAETSWPLVTELAGRLKVWLEAQGRSEFCLPNGATVFLVNVIQTSSGQRSGYPLVAMRSAHQMSMPPFRSFGPTTGLLEDPRPDPLSNGSGDEAMVLAESVDTHARHILERAKDDLKAEFIEGMAESELLEPGVETSADRGIAF